MYTNSQTLWYKQFRASVIQAATNLATIVKLNFLSSKKACFLSETSPKIVSASVLPKNKKRAPTVQKTNNKEIWQVLFMSGAHPFGKIKFGDYKLCYSLEKVFHSEIFQTLSLFFSENKQRKKYSAKSRHRLTSLKNQFRSHLGRFCQFKNNVEFSNFQIFSFSGLKRL